MTQVLAESPIWTMTCGDGPDGLLFAEFQGLRHSSRALGGRAGIDLVADNMKRRQVWAGKELPVTRFIGMLSSKAIASHRRTAKRNGQKTKPMQIFVADFFVNGLKSEAARPKPTS